MPAAGNSGFTGCETKETKGLKIAVLKGFL
jgi:hypothetical protein